MSFLSDDAASNGVAAEQPVEAPASGSPTQTDVAPSGEWASSYDQSYSALVIDQGWKSTDDILKSFKLLKETHDKISNGQGLVMPHDEDDKEGYEAVYKALGRPDDPSGYGFPETEDPIGNDFTKSLTGAMYEAGLSKGQAGKLAEAYTAWATKLQAQQEAEFQAEVDAVTASIKPEQLEAARRGMRFFGFQGEELAEKSALLEKALGPATAVEMFAMLGRKLGEDRMVSEVDAFNVSGSAAQSRIDQKLSDPGFYKRYMSGEQSALDEINRLYERVAAN